MQVLPLLVFLTSSSGNVFAAGRDSDERTAAFNLYKAGNYSLAAECLRIALSQSPNDAVLHYYLANCWAQLGKLDSAAQEYRLTLTLTQELPISEYCRNGLAACTSKMAQSKAGPATVNQSQDEIARAIKSIDDQGQRAKDLRQVEMEREAQANLSEGEKLAARLERERESEIKRMQRATYKDEYGHVYPMYTSEQIQAADLSFEGNIKDAKATGTSKAETVRALGRKNNKQLDDSITYLEEQLKDNRNFKGQKLLPLGTSLYVRNYSLLNQSVSTNPVQQEMMATQEQLILTKHQKDGTFRSSVEPKPYSATADRLPNGLSLQGQSIGSDRTTSVSVYGRLLQSN
jgi:tetratricopeptide (TPR) repeat protein